ncbi:unnamed protein product [Phytomonas sp. EM1]|nr:unnamed protein product [Phytomonas sp. EM1]|eukprot:CCW61669.1 unnamed protein product [Phytomonas sp. isolate EM1]
MLSSSAADPTLLGVEDTYYRAMTQQLRGELEDARGRLREAEAKLQLSEQERQGWEGKYRHLLAEQAPRGGIPPDAADLLRRLTLKEEAITALKRTVDEQAAKLSAAKDAAAAHTAGMMLVKHQLKTLQEELTRKSNERREAVEKLAVAEDKLALQIQTRADLENEMEELRSQITLLQLASQGKRQDRKDEEDATGHSLSLSFGSNGSVDRIMQLENELDDVRTQRNTLQRQLLALQRQVATMPSALADPTAANDTLKAHLRQLEKEKEQLHKQLSEVLERVEIVQYRNDDRAGVEAAGATERMPESTPATATHMPRPPSDRSRRELVLLSSLLLQYGCRNLLLQQHQVLLHGSRAQEARALAARQRAMRLNPARDGEAEDGKGEGGFSGSLLTRQRLEVEQGLLETVIHGRRPLPPPPPPPAKEESVGSEFWRWLGSKKKSQKQVCV